MLLVPTVISVSSGRWRTSFLLFLVSLAFDGLFHFGTSFVLLYHYDQVLTDLEIFDQKKIQKFKRKTF